MELDWSRFLAGTLDWWHVALEVLAIAVTARVTASTSVERHVECGDDRARRIHGIDRVTPATPAAHPAR